MPVQYDVTIKQYNSGVWEIIYPKTKAENIISGIFDVDRIPNLNASKISAGILGINRIPNLDASKINEGTFDAARIPNLNASKINAGVFDVARLPAIALTNTVVSTTMSAFIPLYTAGDMQEGDVLILTGDNKTYIHNGGTAGNQNDFTLLSTPTANVASVAGKTGVVTLVKGDVGLANVDNTSDVNKPVSTAQQTALNAKANKVSITAGTKTKITYNAEGIVIAGASLGTDDIPNLGASKINSGTFDAARIPTLAIAKITGLQTNLDAKQDNIPVVANSSLSSMSPSEGAIVFAT